PAGAHAHPPVRRRPPQRPRRVPPRPVGYGPEPHRTRSLRDDSRTEGVPPVIEPATTVGGTAGTLFRARSLTKTYGTGATRFDALRGIDLDIERGESVAIVGKSGSGKSTLMHVLALLDSPSTGSLQVAGTDAKSLT